MNEALPDPTRGNWMVAPLMDFAFHASRPQAACLDLGNGCYLCDGKLWKKPLVEALDRYEAGKTHVCGATPVVTGKERREIREATGAVVMAGDGDGAKEGVYWSVAAMRLVGDGPVYASPIVALSDGRFRDAVRPLDRPMQFRLRAATTQEAPRRTVLQDCDLPRLRKMVSFLEAARGAPEDFQRLKLALRFYELSWRQVHADVRAVLLWTVLECLFHRDRLCRGRDAATCAARILAKGKEQKKIAKEMADFYLIRNTVAHGSGFGRTKEERDARLKDVLRAQNRLRQLFISLCENQAERHFQSEEGWWKWVCSLLHRQSS